MENLYFVSKYNLGGAVLKPRVPDNFMVRNGYEDGETERVCFSDSVDGCLTGLSRNIEGETFHVHVPDGEYEVVEPTEDQVPDCKMTGEKWICSPVRLRRIGTIQVTGSVGDGIPYRYGGNTAELYRWTWKVVDAKRDK